MQTLNWLSRLAAAHYFVTSHTEDEGSHEHGPSWPRPAGLHKGWASPWWLPGSDWTAASLEPRFPQQQSNPRKAPSVSATGQETCKSLSMKYHFTLKKVNIGHPAMIVNMSNVCLHSLEKMWVVSKLGITMLGTHCIKNYSFAHKSLQTCCECSKDLLWWVTSLYSEKNSNRSNSLKMKGLMLYTYILLYNTVKRTAF